MLNILKFLIFALTAFVLSCADYPELDLSIKEGEPIKDTRDGNEYKTVKIGDKIWMAENLKYMGPKTKCYNDEPKNCQNLGGLYTWVESMDLDEIYESTEYSSTTYATKHLGICPTGWHLPSHKEWLELRDSVGLNSAVKLKTTDGWNSDNGTNEYGFSALPAGWDFDGWGGIGECGAWWSTTESNAKQISSVEICNENEVKSVPFKKQSWASIRCVKD